MEAFIDVRVAPGRYRSAGEVIRAALRLPRENKRKRQNAEPLMAEPLMEAGGAAQRGRGSLGRLPDGGLGVLCSASTADWLKS